MNIFYRKSKSQLLISILILMVFIFELFPDLLSSIIDGIGSFDIYYLFFKPLLVLYFFYVILYYIFWQLDKRPTIVISDQGLLIREISPDMIPWNYIEGAQYKVLSVRLHIEIQISAAWSDRMNLRMRYSVLRALGRGFGLNPFYFSSYLLNVSGDKILLAIRQHIDAAKNRPDGPAIDRSPPP